MNNAVKEAIEYIRKKTSVSTPVGVVLGSGWGRFVDESRIKNILDFGEIPHFPTPSVEGHRGRLVLIETRYGFCWIMDGRIHCYEGYSAKEVVFPVRVLKELGVNILLLANSSGGIRGDLYPGDLVLIRDHINLMGINPLIGIEEKSSSRFIDMSWAYNPELIDMALKMGEESSIPLKEGVLAGFMGPSYESPAEIKMAKILGADVVSMSTIPEVIMAKYLKMNVLCISCVTNWAAGIRAEPLYHEEVLEKMRVFSGRNSRFLALLIPELQRVASNAT